MDGDQIEHSRQNWQYISSRSWKITGRQDNHKARFCESVDEHCVSVGCWYLQCYEKDSFIWIKCHWGSRQTVHDLMFCQGYPNTWTTVHLSTKGQLFVCLAVTVALFSFVLTSCLSRVYHIDSNPSGANDSGPDFLKAFTVRDMFTS